MLTVSSFEELLKDSDEILKGVGVIASDLDHTLIDFDVAQAAGIKAIAQTKSPEFAEYISSLFQTLLAKHQGKETDEKKHQMIIDEVQKIERNIILQYGLRKWCREAWIIITAKQLGVSIDAEEVTKIRDAYWSALDKNSILYKDVLPFLEILKNKNRKLIIMTGSDNLMTVLPDLSLSYDPVFSDTYKTKRVDSLPMHYDSLVIGDPIDKPDPRFFDRVFDQVKKLGGTLEQTLFVGDSVSSDLAFPESKSLKTVFVKRSL